MIEKFLLVLSSVVLMATLCPDSSQAVPVLILAIPLESSSVDTPFVVTNEADTVKRVHRREAPLDQDDLETAAGTNVLRPLFVYRQQMAYRDRQIKRAAYRRAVNNNLL